MSMPGVGDTCATAIPIARGLLSNESTANYGANYTLSNTCAGLGGADRVYAVTIPAGQRLVATVTPAPDYDSSIGLIDETTTFFNSADSPTEIFIVVDGTLARDAGNFGLETEFSSPIEGDMCGSAMAIATGELLGQSFEGFANNYDGGDECASASGRAACDGASHACSTYADAGSRGDAESLRYINVSAETRTVFLIVDTYDGSGSFMLSTAFEE